MIPAQLVRIEKISPSTYTFWLKTDRPLDYTAGQFIEIYIPHNADDRGSHRWFTLSSSPTEKYLAVTVRKVLNMSTFKQQLFNKKPGDTLLIAQAMGDFVLPLQRSIPLLFLVRGIGVTPLRSMMKYLADSNDLSRDINIIHTVRDAHDFLFQDIYMTVSPTVQQIIDASNDNLHEITTQITDISRKSPTTRIYISGPEAFTEKAYKTLSDNVAEPNLITDYFHGYDSQ